MRFLTIVACASLATLTCAYGEFHPGEYAKSVATCPAINRAMDTQVSIDISYVDVNRAAKQALLLVHGWPSLWSTWSQQILEFKDDYHLIIPDLRGFGGSTHPDDVETSGTMGDIVGDLVCVLSHAQIGSAICIGHDWGSQVCYEAARMRPDLFSAVAGIAVPYIPAAGDFVPIEHLVPTLPRLAYQVFFQRETAAAVAELNADIRRTVRATLRTRESAPPMEFLTSKTTFLGGWDGVEEIPPVPFFSPEEEEYFIEQYRIQGFTNTLQFYTHGNRHGSWAFAQAQGNYTIPQPALSILPLHDRVADFVLAARLLRSADFIPRLTTVTLDGSHWVQLENAEGVNKALRSWLADFAGSAGAEHDEL